MSNRLALILQTPLIPFVFEAAEAEGLELVYFHRPDVDVPSYLPAVVEAVPVDIFGDRAGALDTLAREHRRGQFCGILAGNDLAVPFTAEAADRLDLPGIGQQVARRCRDKGLQRSALHDAGLNCPGFVEIATLDQVDAALARLRLPVVVKPTNGANSQGVMRADTVQQARHAASLVADIRAEFLGRVADRSRGERSAILIEEYVDGPELCAESIVVDGVPHVLAVAYKGNPPGPLFEEAEYITPPDFNPGLVEAIRREVRSAHSALGIDRGATHTELRLREGTTPVIIEIGARMGGSGVVAHHVKASTGVDFARLVVRQAAGRTLPPDWLRPVATPTPVAANWIIPLNGFGRFRGVDGLDLVRRHPETAVVIELLHEGDEVPAFPRFVGYPGFVLSEHRDHAACVAFHRFLSETLCTRWDDARAPVAQV